MHGISSDYKLKTQFVDDCKIQEEKFQKVLGIFVGQSLNLKMDIHTDIVCKSIAIKFELLQKYLIL